MNHGDCASLCVARLEPQKQLAAPKKPAVQRVVLRLPHRKFNYCGAFKTPPLRYAHQCKIKIKPSTRRIFFLFCFCKNHNEIFNFLHCIEVNFASFLSGGFTTQAVINPPKRKLAKRTSVHCTVQSVYQSTQLQVPTLKNHLVLQNDTAEYK